MKETGEKKEYIVLALLFTGYLVFNGILLMRHELWRDEANVWLFARDTTPLQLLKEIKYQGHPCLWYFLVMPFAKLGLPFQTIGMLSFLIMAAAAWLFVYRAPFHPVTKAVCLFGPVFSYYYPVVARNYCLIALLLMLLAYFYDRRNEKPVWYGALLGLLVQADTIALAPAGLISLMWLSEGIHGSLKEKAWQPFFKTVKGLWIPLASFVLWLAEFWQVSDSPEFHMRTFSLSEMLTEIRNFSYHILTRMTGQGETFDLLVILLFLAAGVLLSVRLRNFWPMAVTAGAFLFEVIFSLMVYQLHIWHYIALCFVLIWFFWLGGREKNRSGTRLSGAGRILAEGLLIVLGITMFIRWNAPEETSGLSGALFGLYSDGVNAADYIKENVDRDELLVSTDVSEASTVLAYLGRSYTFYFAGNGQAETYANYNESQSGTVSYEELLKWVKASFPEKSSFYLLKSENSCVKEIPDEEKEKWEICYQTKEETARGESYTLYRIMMPDEAQ